MIMIMICASLVPSIHECALYVASNSHVNSFFYSSTHPSRSLPLSQLRTIKLPHHQGYYGVQYVEWCYVLQCIKATLLKEYRSTKEPIADEVCKKSRLTNPFPPHYFLSWLKYSPDLFTSHGFFGFSFYFFFFCFYLVRSGLRIIWVCCEF